MTNYGKIDILWYDGAWPHSAEAWESERLNAMVRSLQPDIIINNRSGVPEDFDTPEQHIRASDRPWETCMTMDDLWWGYHPGDPNLKSSMQLVRNLVKCVARGGNFLLNVGPKADGTTPAPLGQAHLGQVTAKGNTVYIHVMFWPGREMCVAGIKNQVLRAYMLVTGDELPFEQRRDRLFVRGLPSRAPDPIDTVVALELEGEPEAAPASFWK